MTWKALELEIQAELAGLVQFDVSAGGWHSPLGQGAEGVYADRAFKQASGLVRSRAGGGPERWVSPEQAGPKRRAQPPAPVPSRPIGAQRAHARQVYPEAERLLAEGRLSQAEIAERLGVSQACISKLRKRLQKLRVP